MIRVCFVCSGNICRSPTAEGVFRHLVEQGGLAAAIEADSAGTHGYHAGDRPDERAIRAAKRRGVTLGGVARRFERTDFTRFDYVLALDDGHHRHLVGLAGDAHRTKVFLLRDFDPDAPTGSSVPDPYYGEAAGFEEVLDLCESACRHLLEHLAERHGLRHRAR